MTIKDRVAENRKKVQRAWRNSRFVTSFSKEPKLNASEANQRMHLLPNYAGEGLRSQESEVYKHLYDRQVRN